MLHPEELELEKVNLPPRSGGKLAPLVFRARCEQIDFRNIAIFSMKKALYVLGEMSDRDFDWFLQNGRIKRVSTGSVLIQQGETIDAFYIILEGRFSVTVDPHNEREIAQLSYGEIVGEISFVDSRPPTATVNALENSLVWAIPRTQLAAKLSQDVAFSSHFYKSLATFLSDRLRKTVGQLGYDENSSPSEDDLNDLNPNLFGNLELAKARLEWMLSRLKSTH